MKRIIYTSDAILKLSSITHHPKTCTPIRVLNSHLTMTIYRFHAFATRQYHNVSLLLLGALQQGRRHLLKVFLRFECVLQACQCHLLVSLNLSLSSFQTFYTRRLVKDRQNYGRGGGRSKTIGITNIWYAVKYNCKTSKQ